MRRGLPIIGFCALLLSFGDGKGQEASIGAALIYSTDSQQPTIQPADTVFTVTEFVITGNRRTRNQTILREVPFKLDGVYSLSEIKEKIELTKRQVMNTNLFRNVVVNVSIYGVQKAAVLIDVEEKWYLHPEVIVRVANGTFAQWNDRGRRLDHLNYGLKLTQHNFTGRGDRAQIQYVGGYTKRLGLQYRNFFFDREMKWSGSINLAHSKSRELNYITEFNKPRAVKNPDGYLLQSTQASFDLAYRPAIKMRQQFSIGYNYNRIGDTVPKLNENYLPGSKMAYGFPYISYGIFFTDYDFNPYPTRGRYGEVNLHKSGIWSSINLWQLSAKGVNYWPAGKKAFFSISLAGMIKLPFEQPYITQQFMGYGDATLQGYENYIIDGVAGGYSKQTFGFNVIDAKIPLPTTKLFKSLRNIPVKVYMKAYTNQGYVHNPNPSYNNPLNNRMLYSTGVGIDVLLFTDLLFKFEWSFNQLGQNGLYLHQ